MARRRSLALRGLLFVAGVAAAALTGLVGGLALAFHWLADPAARPAFLLAGIIAGFALLGALAWIWLRFAEAVARPAERLAGELRARAHGPVDAPFDAGAARHLGDLGPAAEAVTGALADTRGALDAAVARQTARIAAENARLELVLRDVPVGVVLCTAAHRIALYNTQATRLLAGAGELGLDRSLFDLLIDGPIRHGCDRLALGSADDRGVELLCATRGGGRILQGRMRLLDAGPSGQAASGYVLTLHDVTEDLTAGFDRDRLLRDLLEQVRRPAANLLTTLEVLREMPALAAADRERLQAAMAGEAETLADLIAGFGRRYDAAAPGWWPLADASAADVLDTLAARLARGGLALETAARPLVLRCDGYALVLLLSDLAACLRAAGAGAFSATVVEDGAGAVVDLGWQGPELGVDEMDILLARPLEGGRGGYGAYTGRDVLVSHGTEMWPERDGPDRFRLRLPIREARPEGAAQVISPRVEFYDFDLLDSRPVEPGDDRDLAALTFVVFDTETTGLQPDRGDEIVQIAAVRIVNGRILSGEAFDTLVHPGRPIPAPSTRIHGITDAMVASAPRFDEAARRFRRYCGDSVLVAHNAPFDLAFFHRRGVTFDNPVLDTVLLSAILYGPGAEHSLDALAARLGVAIAEDARHTAIGDACATAEVLRRMIPALREAGLATLGDTFAAFRAHRGQPERRPRRA